MPIGLPGAVSKLTYRRSVKKALESHKEVIRRNLQRASPTKTRDEAPDWIGCRCVHFDQTACRKIWIADSKIRRRAIGWLKSPESENWLASGCVHSVAPRTP
jgi:hypothetical protein